MAQLADAWLEHQRKRFTRHDAHRWWRCDAERYRRLDPRFQHGRSLFEDKAWADQPRVPPGSSEGGQWTSSDGQNEPQILSDATPDRIKPGDQLAQYQPPRGPIPGPTPAQNARLVATQMRADTAIRRIQEVDPNWRPRETSLTVPNSVEGQIARAEARLEAAETRLRSLARESHGKLLDAYRENNATPDLFRHPWSRDKYAVAVATPEQQQLFFGMNSSASTYTTRDAVTAGRELVSMIEQFPEVMNMRDLRGWPNYSLYHAESTILFRMRDAFGGTLAGRNFEITVDKPLCLACEYLLPHLGRHLGNPRVTWYDDMGLQGIMHYGRWLPLREKKQ